MKIALGEFAEVLLGRQRALPIAAQEAGSLFLHTDLEKALRALLAKM